MKVADRLLWPDFLRVISCFSVVLIHVTSVGINNYESYTNTYLISVLVNSLVRWAVPVFFMVSGMFLLDPIHSVDKPKIIKKISRLLLIIIVWGIFYSLLDDVSNHIFSFKSFPIALLNVWKGVGGYHLWFLYTLVLLYVALPILRIVTKHASEKQIIGIILAWFILSICAGWLNDLGREIPYISIISVKWSFEFITGYAGYFLLGYLLYKYELGLNKIYKIAIPVVCALILTGCLCCIKIFDCDPSVVAEPLGALTCLLSASIFLLCKEMKIKKEFFRKIIQYVSDCSLGIYLIHVFWIMLIFHIFNVNYILFGDLSFVIWSAIVLLLSLGSTVLIKKIPYIKKIITM